MLKNLFASINLANKNILMNKKIFTILRINFFKSSELKKSAKSKNSINLFKLQNTGIISNIKITRF